MECSQVRAILLEHVDTEIPREFREGVEAHLAVCRSCAMQLEALREELHALGNMPKMEAPVDFLDRVRSRVETPSVLSRLKQRLSGWFAGKRFLQLAGAAATAALVLITAQVVLRDAGNRKGLPSPALPPIGSTPSPEAPPASPALTGSLPDVRRNTEKALNPASSSMAEPHRLADVEEQSVALTLKLPGASAGGKTRGGSFRPESFSSSNPGTTGMGATAERRLKQGVSKGVAGPAEVSEGSPAPGARKTLSSVIRLIERVDGKVLNAGAARDEHRFETLLAEIPAANYPAFLDRLRRLGEVEFNGDKEFSPAPGARIRVSIGFDIRD